MNLPLIPAPATTTTHDGTFVVTDGLGVVVQSPELAGLAERFVADVQVDAGIALFPGSAGITVLIDSDGIDGLAPAAGLRADGNASADERYGLEITSEGVRVWGPTAEAVLVHGDPVDRAKRPVSGAIDRSTGPELSPQPQQRLLDGVLRFRLG